MTDDRELVVRALRRLAETARQGQDPDAHPTVEEIVAYHAGELPEQQQQALQQHLLLCRDCPDLILALDGFAKLPDGEIEALPAGMDSAWESVRRRLAAEGWFEGGRSRRSRWAPRYLLAAAAILMVACLGFFLLRPTRSMRIVTQPPSGLPQWEVPPTVRGEESPKKIGDRASEAGFTLKASPEGRWASPEYEVELLKPGGGRLWSHSWQPESPASTFFLVVPGGSLSPGEYLLRLSGRHAAPEPVDERRFRLAFR